MVKLTHLLLVTLVLLLAVVPTRAADIFVDGTLGDDANDGLTPATAVRTLTQGFALVGPAGTLDIAEGLYSASTGQTLPATGNGDLVVRGAGPGLTILDGEGLSQVLSLSGDTLLIEGLTIRNGNSGVGAGLNLNQPLSLEVRNVHFEDNEASIGAALHVQQNSRATAGVVRDCHFTRNHAAIGAGIQYQINTDEDATLEIYDTIFDTSCANIGGAIQFQENGLGRHELIVHRCVFRDNSGAGAGGVHFQRNAGTAFGEFRETLF